jgi:hypothetical protein
MHEGLACGTCIAVASENLALVCRDLEGKSLEHIFSQMHQKRGCRKMFREFETAYHMHVDRSLRRAVETEIPLRRVARCA